LTFLFKIALLLWGRITQLKIQTIYQQRQWESEKYIFKNLPQRNMNVKIPIAWWIITL
jgi:hypothetical protein